jgi:uncharacterized Zn finger protein (UPF0148 family)
MVPEPYVVLTCPLCDRSSLHPSEKTSKDQLVQAISKHVLNKHPRTVPREAELTLESAVEASIVETFDPNVVESGQWIRRDER